MTDSHALNAKEKKQFYEKIRTYFGAENFTFPGMIFVNQKNKYHILDETYKEIIDIKINTKVLGLYVAEINKFGEIRLSIEGSQLVGPHATKHTLELSQEEAELFINGKDLDVSNRDVTQEYFILYTNNPTTNQKDYLGCGKVKDNVLFNFVPKGRRVL